MKFNSFADLINQVKGKSNRVVVPGANNREALEAIKMADGKAKVDSDTCVDCGACVATCPVEAISQE